MTATRRLSATLPPDLIGYSRLMNEDEAGGARSGVKAGNFLRETKIDVILPQFAGPNPCPTAAWRGGREERMRL